MKRNFLILIIGFLSLQSCSVMKDVTSVTRQAKYSVSLEKVEFPKNPKVEFSEKIVKEIGQDITSYSFEDDYINIIWKVYKDKFSFILNNKTNNTLKIAWDDVIYVNTNRSISKMIHSGIKYNQKIEQQVPATIPGRTKLEDILVPIDNIKFEYDGWAISPLFPNPISSDYVMQNAISLEGENISIFLPIKIDDIVNEYTFTFKIDKVEIETITTKWQEHDIEAEKATGFFWGLATIVGVIILIAVAL